MHSPVTMFFVSGAAKWPTQSSKPGRATMMVVPDFATTDQLVDAVRLVNQERLQARSRDLPYRLAVLGTDTTDLVKHAGGLLFDHIMAGWCVTVLLPPEADPRPLQILGTRVFDLNTALAMDLVPALASRRHSPWPHKVVLAGDLCARDTRLHDAVRHSFDHGDTNTMLWGSQRPTVDDGDVMPVEHQLSRAAVAFKSHALAATAAGGADVAPAESFMGNTVHTAAPPALHLT